MTKPFFWIALVVLALNLFAFQNCGKIASSQIESASEVGVNKADDSSQLMAKQIIVRMKDDVSNAQLTSWASSNGLANMNSSDGSLIDNWESMRMSHWNWEGSSTVAEVQAKLSAADFADKIEFAEPNYILNTTNPEIETFSGVTQLTAAEPYSTQLQFLNGQLTPIPENLTPLERNSIRPIIAIIDSGANINHESFTDADALWVNSGEIPNNGIDDDRNGFIDDYHGANFINNDGNLTDQTGHGTHVAGIALGVGHNIFDLDQDANMFPADRAKVQLMILKFIGPNGGATSDAINAIFYAVNKRAKVLNNSWGGSNYSRALEDAILFAYEQEVVFVAAAGNSSSNNDTKAIYPANYNLPNVISVAATNNADSLTSFSNFGLSSVDIAAPGSFILSTSNHLNNESFRTLSGTSMSSPMVAGVAGLMLYEKNSLKAHQIKNIIIQQADGASTLSGRLKNASRLNPNFAVAEAKITDPALTKPAFSRSFGSADAAEEAPKAGCGLVKLDTPNPPKGPPPIVLLALLMLPLAVAVRFKFAA